MIPPAAIKIGVARRNGDADDAIKINKKKERQTEKKRRFFVDPL